MVKDKLIIKTIKSYCKSLNIDIKGNFLYFKGLVIFENPFNEDIIFNTNTLNFLEGFKCGLENQEKIKEFEK